MIDGCPEVAAQRAFKARCKAFAALNPRKNAKAKRKAEAPAKIHKTRADHRGHRFSWWLSESVRGIVYAFTRSEARSEIKRRLGLKRLPCHFPLIDEFRLPAAAKSRALSARRN